MENKITANELRISNLLYFKNTNDICTVELIHKKHFDCRDIDGGFYANGNYEPIPLTEEWLLKFGFNKRKIYFELGKLAISLNGIEYDNGRTYFNSWTILEKQPEYVHQLQNLYFALTNEELTIK